MKIKVIPYNTLEYASLDAFPATGESGKHYLALDTMLLYTWSSIASQYSRADFRYEGRPAYHGSYLKSGYLEFTMVASPTLIDWHNGDYIRYDRTGRIYKLYGTPQVERQASTNHSGESFAYRNVQFYDKTKDLSLVPFRDLVPGAGGAQYYFSSKQDVAFTGTVANVVERLNANLANFFGTGVWNVRIADNIPESFEVTIAKDFSVSGMCQDALNAIYETWHELGWAYAIENGVDTIIIGYPNIAPATSGNRTNIFSYDNGLTALKRNNGSMDNFCTRMHVYGTERNLINRYYNGKDIYNAGSVNIPNLMIPIELWGQTNNKPDANKAFIEDADKIEQYGLITKDVYFDGTDGRPEIFPSIEQQTIEILKAAKTSLGKTGAGAPDYYPQEADDTIRVDQVKAAVQMPQDEGTPTNSGERYIDTYDAAIASTIVNAESVTGRQIREEQLFEYTFVDNGVVDIRWNGALRCVLDQALAAGDYITLRLCVYKDSVSRNTMVSSADFKVESDITNGQILNLDSVLSIGSKTEQVTGRFVVTLQYAIISEGSGTRTITITKEGDVLASANIREALVANFKIKTHQIGFDIAKMQSSGGAVIAVKSGMCAGREFSIVKAIYNSEDDDWTLTCKRSQDTSTQTYYPNATFAIAADDEFVILGITMPEEYILAQAHRLYTLGQELFDKVSVFRPTFEPSIDSKKVLENITAHPSDEQYKLVEGKYMRLYDEDLIADDHNTDVMISEITINEGEAEIATYHVVLSDKANVTGGLSRTVANISTEVENIQKAQRAQVRSQELGSQASSPAMINGGTNVNPIYVKDGIPQIIDGLEVDYDVLAHRNVEAMWGVSAFGIANMAMSGTGGGGTVTAVSVNGTRYTPSNGLITLPDYPSLDGYATENYVASYFGANFTQLNIKNTLGISDWALASTKPSYNFSEIGAKPSTLGGYGISDAHITNGEITLGQNTITPATLNNGKIPLSQIPDAILGQMLYGGTVNGSGAVTLSQNAKDKWGITSLTLTSTNYADYEGAFFIASANGSSGVPSSLGVLVGDWIIATSAGWGKIDNTDAVTGVKGNAESSYRIGNVNITPANIGLGNVENTALSTWVGTNNITTLGTITTGVWNGSAIGYNYLASGVQASLDKADTALQQESDPIFTASAAHGITSNDISTWNAKQNALAFDGTYDASTNKVATKSTVTNAINALDVSNISGFGAGKTLASLTETDGKIAATFQDISITKSQVSDFPTTWALANVTGADDLKAIEALTGTSGFLKKTAANTWSLDTDVASGTALSGVSTRVGTLESYFNSGKLKSDNIDLATGDDNGQVKIAGTNVSVKGWNTAATHAHGDYVTAVGIDATNGKLKWYLGGVAQTAPNIVAARLVDTNKTMFGNTYWTSSGIPASIGTATAPAALDYVTNIDGLLYFDKTNRKVEVGTSASPADLCSMGGVSAMGIANMAINGGGGQGTLTQIKVNGTAIADVNGVVNITATTGNANGKIAIAGQQIPVYGLGTLAYASSLSFDNLSSHPTTLGGYGITDAKIANGVITIGSNSITPLTGITSSMVTTALGYTPYDAANFTQANIKSTLGISDWALAASKPSYAFSEITGTVTNAQLAGSIANSKLASAGKFTIGSTAIELGTTYTAANFRSYLGLGGAATYGATSSVTDGGTSLVTSGGVYSYVNALLTAAMKIEGETTTAISDGSTTNPVTIGGQSVNAYKGMVVFYGSKEFVWVGTAWKELGDESSFALKTTTVSGTGYLTGGGALSSNQTIDIASSVKTKIDNGATAYGWGNHASAGYALASNLGTASTHAHGDYVTGMSWDSTNNKLAWSKGGTAQTAITIGYASSAGSVAWGNVSSKPDTATRWPSWEEVTGKPNDYARSSNMSFTSGSEFVKVSDNDSWNGQVYSKQGYKECRVTYKIGQTNAYIMVGLNSDPTKDASYSSIDYCWYTKLGGVLEIYENGTDISSITGHTTYTTGDELIVEYSNGVVRYYHNGVLCRSVNRAYGTPLYFDSSFYTISGKIYDVYFGPIHNDSSVSLSGSTLTVKINGVEKSLTNTNTTYSPGTGLSLSGTTFNHSNSVTAQTTQGLYPIKIDAQGHISAYGSAVTSLPASDVYAWAKAASKPSYHAGELNVPPTSYKITSVAAGIAPYISDIGTNIFSGATTSEITVERSLDNGATWTDVTSSEAANVKNVFSGCVSGNLIISGHTKAVVGDRLRITFNPSGSSRYCQLAFIYVYFNSNGCGCLCDIEKNLYTDKTAWTTHVADAPIAGWSGPNIVGMGGTIFGQNDSRNQGYGLRFTFRITSVNADYDSRGYIYTIRGFTANKAWGTPSGNSIAKTNTPYTYVNADRAVSFDNTVAATGFYENGTALSSKYLGINANAVSATKATNDSDGNAINTTYLKLSGGTTPLQFNSNNLPQFSESIPYFLGIEAFASGGTVKWQQASRCSVGYATSAGNADTLDGQHGSYYATASSVTTLQGYFTSGVANSAAKLTTVSKTAWGQTFWTSGGIPASISGDMSSVGNITPSADKQKNLGSESLQFNYVYAHRLITNSGNGLRYCSTTGKHAWYNSYTTDDTTKQMELTNSALTIYKDVQGMGGVSAMGIASMAINSMSGISFASQIAMNGQTYNATSGLITLPNFTDAYNPSGTGSTTQALSQKGAKALYTTLNNAIPATATIAGWGYKKGMVYSTSTASDSGIQVATGADPTYQYITNTSQSSLVITVTTDNAAANSYGVHRYIMIYNNRSSATLVQFADQGQGVVGPADNVTIPANSYMEFSIIHPASNAKCMVTWSMPLKNIETM